MKSVVNALYPLSFCAAQDNEPSCYQSQIINRDDVQKIGEMLEQSLAWTQRNFAGDFYNTFWSLKDENFYVSFDTVQNSSGMRITVRAAH